MPVSHSVAVDPRSSGAMSKLRGFLQERRQAVGPVADFEAFEQQLHAMFAAAECEALGEELERLDLDVPMVTIDGVPHRRVVRCEETYFSAAGPLRVTRSLYATREGSGERAECPLELRAGIVDGRWTPQAAKQAVWVVAHLTPQTAEELFETLGGMKPSKAALDRLPKRVSERWEKRREELEAALRKAESVPAEAVSVGISLDGVMVPMKDGERLSKREQAKAEGKRTRGPAGHQEVGCGTLTFYDKEGERLRTVRLGRMPEKKKATLKATLTAELMAALAARPDLTVVRLADGAKDNWSYLSELAVTGPQVVDFFHAAEHLASALDAAYGENTPKSKAQLEKLRHVLRHDAGGVEKVIRALSYLRQKHRRKKQLTTELKYFRRRRGFMRYAEIADQKLPIGTGVTEAACKTLATQRMKCSGMAWREMGGQAVLTLRALIQSGRFHSAWKLIVDGYKREIAVPKNVIPFPCRPVLERQ